MCKKDLCDGCAYSHECDVTGCIWDTTPIVADGSDDVFDECDA